MNTVAKYTFEQYTADFDAACDEEEEYELTEKQAADLTELVEKFGEKELKPTHYTLRNFYSIAAPDELLKQVLKKNLQLAMESYNDTIWETFSREQLMDAISEHIEMPKCETFWASGTTWDYAEKKYLEALKEVAPKFGITVL